MSDKKPEAKSQFRVVRLDNGEYEVQFKFDWEDECKWRRHSPNSCSPDKETCIKWYNILTTPIQALPKVVEVVHP